MNQNNQNQPQDGSVALSYSAGDVSSGPYAAPPPAGYPSKDGGAYPAVDNSNNPRVETRSRGDGFWEGCCAALCCCCVLESCF